MIRDPGTERSARRRSRARRSTSAGRRSAPPARAARGSCRRCPGSTSGHRSGRGGGARSRRPGGRRRAARRRPAAVRHARRPTRCRGAGVEAVAAARRQRRRARDRLAQGAERGAADRLVAVHGGELREEQADARGAVVEVRLERAVLGRHGSAGSTTRRSSCSGRRPRPRRPRCAGDRRGRVEEREVRGHAGRRARLEVGRVDLHAVLGEAGDDRVQPLVGPRMPASWARTIPSASSAQRRTPKLSPLPSASASPTPGASSRVNAGTRGRRCARSASATSRASRGARRSSRPGRYRTAASQRSSRNG